MGATGIYKFFDKYATDYPDDDGSGGDGSSASLGGWKWPTVQSDEDLDLLLRRGGEGETGSDMSSTGSTMHRHEVFDLLFTKQTDEAIQLTLLTTIRSSWDESTNGIVIGTNYFDKVGTNNPYAEYDAVKTAFRLKEDLGIVNNRDVVIVLLYRSPRLDQWTSIVQDKSTSSSSSSTDDQQQPGLSYHDLVCNGDNTNDTFLYEMLDTSMNPLKLANAYRQHRFSVVVIDEMGVDLAGKDIAHIFACNVLHDGVDCEDEWITDLGPTGHNDNNDMSNMWEDKDAEELERIFQRRDCAYKGDLIENESFQVIRQSELWKYCSNNSSSETRENLMDTDFFLDVIKSQQGCGSQSNEVLDILSQAPPPPLPSTKTKKGTEVILWIFIPLMMITLAVTVGVLLIRRRRRKSSSKASHGENTEGLFNKGTSSRSGKVCWFFWWYDQHDSSSGEGSTEGSSDDESPPKVVPSSRTTTTPGFVDVCIDAMTNPVPMTFLARASDTRNNQKGKNLCRACAMVGIDPKCTFCGGGRFSPSSGSQDDTSSSSIVERNNRWNGMARVVRGGTDTSAATSVVNTTAVEERNVVVKTFQKQQQPEDVGGTEIGGSSETTSSPYVPNDTEMVAVDLDDLNERWHSSTDSQQNISSSPPGKKDNLIDASSVYDIGPCRRGGHQPNSNAKKSSQSKSTAFRKLKQLLDLKKTEDEHVDGRTRNIQLGRNTEIGDDYGVDDYNVRDLL